MAYPLSGLGIGLYKNDPGKHPVGALHAMPLRGVAVVLVFGYWGAITNGMQMP